MIGETNKDCPICGRDAETWGPVGRRDWTEISCPSCGEYTITRHARVNMPALEAADPLLRRRIMRYLWERSGQGDIVIMSDPGGETEVDGRFILGLEAATHLYKDEGSVLEKYDRTVCSIESRTKVFGQSFTVDKDRWVVPIMDDDEAFQIVSALYREGYVDGVVGSGGDWDIHLTPEGLRHSAQLARQTTRAGTKVFVAACFSDDLAACRGTIREVVEQFGYSATIVNELPHNDLIDLQIYEGIRESRFVVADLTCNRQSVYYEVGFAHGLGLDVVLTCRADCLGPSEDDFKRVHFDLNHRNILVWNDEHELAKRLTRHIYQSFGKAG